MVGVYQYLGLNDWLLHWKNYLIGCQGTNLWSRGMKTQFTCNIYAQTLLSVWEAYIVGKGILTKVQECGFNEVQSMKMVCMRMSFQ